MARLRGAIPAFLLLAGCRPEGGVHALRPELTVAPEALDFGGVVLLYSESQDVQILNTGRAPLEISALAVEGNEDLAYTLSVLASAAEPLVLEEGESAPATVTFEPLVYEPYDRDLVITWNNPEEDESPDLRVPLRGEGIDGPTPDIAVSPLGLDFGYVAPGNMPMIPLLIENVGDAPLTISSADLSGSGTFKLSYPLDNYVLAPGTPTSVLVTYAPTHELGDNASLSIRSDDPDESKVEVIFLGNGGGDFEYPVARIDCPEEVDPPEDLTLDGRGSFDPMETALTYEWTLLQKPAGSSGSIDSPSADVTSVNVDAAGEWIVGLQVTNEYEITSAMTTCAFDAAPDEQIYVQLTWDKGDADADLHLVQYGYEIFQEPGDCTWCNQDPLWGEATLLDDPHFALDNERGYGPETIVLDQPYDGDYDVYVHYFQDDGGGTVVATARVFLGGALFGEYSQVMEHNQVWEVGYVRWPEATFVPLETPLYDQDPAIRECYTP